MVRHSWTPLFTFLSFVAAINVPRQTNDGVHLAITPTCGKLGGNFTNVNAGIVTAGIKTLPFVAECPSIDHSLFLHYDGDSLSSVYTTPPDHFLLLVAFGDSYTSGGRSDGGTLPPAVLTGTNPRAGGRVTDGPVWAEDVASDLGATIKDYAVAGAVVNVTLWPSKAGQSDFLHQAALFLSQKNILDPTTTLYAVFFGINDFSATNTDGNHLPQAAADLLTQIQQLAAPPTNAKNILVVDDYGFGTHAAIGDEWKQAVFAGLSTLRAQGLNVAFVDFAPLWDAVLGPTPGFAAFGYKNSGDCIPTANQTNLAGECATPLNSFYWLPSHPSKETHQIMADYVMLVLANCKA